MLLKTLLYSLGTVTLNFYFIKEKEIMLCYPAVFLTRDACLPFIRSFCQKELILKIIYS